LTTKSGWSWSPRFRGWATVKLYANGNLAWLLGVSAPPTPYAPPRRFVTGFFLTYNIPCAIMLLWQQ
jgi:hypothetical protein